jgi:hypothetical protein
MSLYKRAGSPHYWCRFTLGGRRIRQSTATEDRKEAEEYEHRLQGRICRETRLGERTGTWDQAVKKWNEERTARASTKHRDKEITDWFSLAIRRLLAVRHPVVGWLGESKDGRAVPHLSPEHLKQYAAHSKLKG